MKWEWDPFLFPDVSEVQTLQSLSKDKTLVRTPLQLLHPPPLDQVPPPATLDASVTTLLLLKDSHSDTPMTTPLLYFFCFVFFFPLTYALGVTSTVAIVHNSNFTTVCAILAGDTPRSVFCSYPALLPVNREEPIISLLPNTSFLAISGGRDFLCGLRSDSKAIFCWSPAENFTVRRIYLGPDSFDSLTVGEDHVAAGIETGGVSFWRGEGHFPENVTRSFKSLTSGNGFSCGIAVVNNRVSCWGSGNSSNISQNMQNNFGNLSMSTLVAGDSHMCGLDADGFLICKGRNHLGQFGMSNSSSPYEFSSLALGSSHTCGIRRNNGTVVCWGGSGDEGKYEPIGNTSMEVIVAGGNLTCGITTSNFSLLCWGLEKFPQQVILLPFPQILPGFCTNVSSCGCGVFPDSERLCSGIGIICKSCDVSPSVFPPPPLSPPVAQKLSRSKGFWAFTILGSVGALIGISTVVYCLITGVFKQKKVHNSVQPTIAGAANSTSISPPNGTPFSSPSKSMRSRSARLLRQGSRLMMMKRQRSGPSSSRNERAMEFSFKELEAATDNFSPGVKIGGGSFGTVYKGKLVDGREVAIKRSEPGQKKSRFQEKEVAFQSELAFLSRLHHKHLVSLVGFCEEGDERLLVYEYMKNGSLHDHLHSPDDCNLLNTWKMRIKVLLDASRGIEYLHNYAVPHIIHRDIKSSNILLDADWTARVSDFGLSLHGPAPPQALMKAAGTVGYIDPEYYGLHHLTVKSDVYGLGVVMLEVLTGKRAVFRNGDEKDPTSVVDYAIPLIAEGEVGRLLDKRVASLGPREAEALELVAYTAVHCVRLEAKERPAMSDVVANLENALAICGQDNGSFSSIGVSRTLSD